MGVPPKKRQPVSFQNGCPCFCLFGDVADCKKIGKSHIHGITAAVPCKSPQKDPAVGAQVHKAFRGIAPYPDFHIPFQITDDPYHAASLKISDFGDFSFNFHIFIGIVGNAQTAAAHRDPAGFGLQDDAFLRIF